MGAAKLKKIALEIKKLGEEVSEHLGCGFNEVIYQNALAIEFRNKGIEYLKEVNIEIFYKGESVGVDRPDFIITKIGTTKEPILLETKVADKIADSHRIQLKSYCTSLPFNNNPVLKKFAGGLLLYFPACDLGGDSSVKTFVVNPDFKVLVDDQADEDAKKTLQKEKLKQEKKKKNA